jgi:hypothetical protein
MTDHELLNNLHRRMDKQDDLLREMSDALNRHIATEEMLRPHLEDLVALWRGSRAIAAIITALAALLGGLWALVAWARDHVK